MKEYNLKLRLYTFSKIYLLWGVIIDSDKDKNVALYLAIHSYVSFVCFQSTEYIQLSTKLLIPLPNFVIFKYVKNCPDSCLLRM